MKGFPAVPPLMSFDEACVLAVAYLKDMIPLRFWAVSRYEGDDRQVYVCVQDDAYGITAGDSHAWSDSLCQHMVTGAAPQIAPDVMAVPQYASVGVVRGVPIGAYVGVPIRNGGKLFGTLCGLDPAVQQPDLCAHAPLLRLLAALLEQILRAEDLWDEAIAREAELDWRAFHDELTGLPNRAMFLDRLGHALDLHRRDLRPLAVLMFDLDDFKAVNDTLGHACGDDLLIRVAERVRGAVRPGDTLARLSGDEFAVLLEDGGDPVVTGARVLSALEAPFTIEATSIRIGASLGIAALPAAAEAVSVDTMLVQAEIAMYTAKRGGKGRLALYDPVMTVPEARDLQLREPLRHAIASGGIEAFYQPIVELDSGRVVAFEALARWTHDSEAVSPEVFIPIAARSGLLPALTDHMLELAGAQLARWSQQLGHQDLRVCVNVPPGLITDPEFPGKVADCIRRHALAPQQLVLEITEDALLTDLPAVRDVTHQLRAVGATLSLDDFGVGYSSLLHLQQIPLQSVKIDRGFTRDLGTNPRTERFMRALLALGRDLGLNVIVEGVECPAQADVLRRLGCTHAQGYLFARAAHPDDLRALLGLTAPLGS